MDKRPLVVIALFFIVGIILGRFPPDSVRLFHVFVATLILITLTLTLSHKWEREYGVGSLKRERECKVGGVAGKIAHVFLFLSIISVGALLYLSSNIFPPGHISYFLGKERVKERMIN